MSGDVRDFNNIEWEMSIFFFLQGTAPQELHAIVIEILGQYVPSYASVKIWGGGGRLNVVIFPPVMSLVLNYSKE
jgi:hypothetical protein